MSTTILSSTATDTSTTDASSSAADTSATDTTGQPITMTNEFRDAFFLLRPRLQALPEESLKPLNRGTMTAVTTVLGAIVRVEALKPRIVTELPLFDLSRIDELRTICLALSYAQATSSPSPPLSAEELVACGAEGDELRGKLRRDGLYLASYRLLDGRPLENIKSQPGYRTIATDLLTEAAVFQENWAAITGKTLVTREEIERAVVLAHQLLQTVGERDDVTASATETSQLRQRAFTLLVLSYNQVRRAVTYLLWDTPEQIEIVCPSIYAVQRSKRASKPEQDETPGDDDVTPPVTEPAQPGKTPEGTGGVVTGNAVNRLPGGNPFQP